MQYSQTKMWNAQRYKLKPNKQYKH